MELIYGILIFLAVVVLYFIAAMHTECFKSVKDWKKILEHADEFEYTGKTQVDDFTFMLKKEGKDIVSIKILSTLNRCFIRDFIANKLIGEPLFMPRFYSRFINKFMEKVPKKDTGVVNEKENKTFKDYL